MNGICGALSFGKDDFVGSLTPLLELPPQQPEQELWQDATHCALAFRGARALNQSLSPRSLISTLQDRYALALNGEIYNSDELRRVLVQEGVSTESICDADLVLLVLAHWGDAGLSRLNGMFALAFYDKQNKTLLLARDHAGTKPLYYLSTNQGIVFGSQYNQLLAHPASRQLGVSTSGLALYLQLGFIPAPYGILQQTHMLQHGAWLRVSCNGLVEHGHFYEFSSCRQAELAGEEALEVLNDALTTAISQRANGNVPIGTLLSGGIDSPLITAKAYAANQDIKAFTVGTQGDRWDETEDAKIYAQQIGVEHIINDISPDDSIALLDDIATAYGEPFGDFSAFPSMLISKLAHEEVSIILAGDCGDELFWGNPRRFATIMQNSRYFAAPLWQRKIRWGIKKVSGWGNAFPQITWPTIGDWFLSKQTMLADYQLKELFPQSLALPRGFTHFKYAGHEINQTAHWARSNLYNCHMHKAILKMERASAYQSMLVRYPFLDKNVIDIASRMDWPTCLDLDNMVGKLPLRRLLNRHVKYETQPKRGFTPPMGQWLRGPLRPVFETHVFQRDNYLGIPFNPQAARDLFTQFENGLDCTLGLWLLLSLALWEEKHYKNRF